MIYILSHAAAEVAESLEVVELKVIFVTMDLKVESLMKCRESCTNQCHKRGNANMLLTFNSNLFIHHQNTTVACSINLNTLLKFIEQSAPSTSSSIKKNT